MKDESEPPLLNNRYELNDDWVKWHKEKYQEATPQILAGSIGIRLILMRANIDVQLRMIWDSNSDSVFQFLEEIPYSWEAIQASIDGKTKPSWWKSFINLFKKVK